MRRTRISWSRNQAKGVKVDKIAVVNENTEYGTSTGNAIIAAATAKGLKVDLRIAYNANSSDVSAQVLQLKDFGPDVVIFVSYTSDSILFMKTMHTLNWKPPVLIGDDSGFSDTAFIEGCQRPRAGRDQPQFVRCQQARIAVGDR